MQMKFEIFSFCCFTESVFPYENKSQKFHTSTCLPAYTWFDLHATFYARIVVYKIIFLLFVLLLLKLPTVERSRQKKKNSGNAFDFCKCDKKNTQKILKK